MDTISVTLLCFFIISSWEFVEKDRKPSKSVIPAKAGIQHINDFVDFNFLDPGFRRGDEAFFNKLLGVVVLYFFSAQTLFDRDDRGFHARMHPPFAQEGLDVELDGSVRVSEGGRYHLV